MGYFANGVEGDDYYEAYCSRCVHDQNGSCPIWLLHILYNYQESDNEHSFLDLLIPRSDDGGGNEQCRLFHEDQAEI